MSCVASNATHLLFRKKLFYADCIIKRNIYHKNKKRKQKNRREINFALKNKSSIFAVRFYGIINNFLTILFYVFINRKKGRNLWKVREV